MLVRHRPLGPRSGAALLWSLLISFVMITTSFVFASLGRSSHNLAQVHLGKAQAQALANAATEHAVEDVTQALDAYRKILNERTTLVLSASSNLLKLLTEGIPELSDESAPTSQPIVPAKGSAWPSERDPVSSRRARSPEPSAALMARNPSRRCSSISTPAPGSSA